MDSFLYSFSGKWNQFQESYITANNSQLRTCQISFTNKYVSSLHVQRLYVEMISISFVFDINVNTIILFVLMIVDGYHISYFSIKFPSIWSIFTQRIVFIRYFWVGKKIKKNFSCPWIVTSKLVKIFWKCYHK